MNKSFKFRWTAALLVALAALVAVSCGGGGSDSTTVPPVVDTGSNEVPVVDIPGPIQYPGQQPPDNGTPDPDPGTTPPAPGGGSFNFGPNIFSVPLDSNGSGRIQVNQFSPGQKVAMVAVNLNPQYLDAHANPDGSFPQLPESAYSITADLLVKGGASVQPSELEVFADDAPYAGMEYDGSVQHPYTIYQREAHAQGEVAFAAQPPVKSTSSIQKGEVRTFALVPPTFPPPPVVPGEENPERDLDDLNYPFEYAFGQDGRVVAIGAHCIIFLSTEINDGEPDTIQFTEARLNRLAREFDTVIFPTMQAAFGPVRNYLEGNIFRDVDRDFVLTGDDFDANGNLLIDLPGTVDTALAAEQKIPIFLYNEVGGAGGFFSFSLSQAAQQALIDEGRLDEMEDLVDSGTALYIQALNMPANDDGWSAAYSVLAHEFQHKLHHDNNVSDNRGPHGWFNEGLSMLAIHVCGYTVNSGQIIDWAIDGQLTDYLAAPNLSAVPMDGNRFFTNQTQYGNSFLFFLYLYEHYPAGLGKRIYDRAQQGERNRIRLIEHATGEEFEHTYTKFAIANFVDGVYTDDPNLFDSRFRYNTIDLKGTVNLWTGTIKLPGVATGEFPVNGVYPATSIHRPCIPWGCDYVTFGNGDGRDLDLTLYSDPNFRFFLLPVEFNTQTNQVDVTPGVVITD